MVSVSFSVGMGFSLSVDRVSLVECMDDGGWGIISDCSIQTKQNVIQFIKLVFVLNDVGIFMDFNRLYSFIKVAERGSITKAAGDLYLTQQAISKQMLLLEDELNLNLFNRSHNAIVLTRDGETLVGNVSPLFDNIKESISQLQGEMESLEGVIKIGTSFDSSREKLAFP